jgi:hypothetical protein
MKKHILLGMTLLTLLDANTITLNGKVEVASVVGFNQAEVESLAYQTGTNTFNAIEINSALIFDEYFKIVKNIYAKSNSSDDLEIRLESANYGGQLQATGGNSIAMKYTIDGTVIDMAGETWVTIPTTVNTLTTITDGFKARSKTPISSAQPAGDYSVILNVTVRAKI